jgi:hypothetical protein
MSVLSPAVHLNYSNADQDRQASLVKAAESPIREDHKFRRALRSDRFELAVTQAIKLKAESQRRTDSGRSRYRYMNQKQSTKWLNDFVGWLDRNSRSLRETIDRMKIRKILGVAKLR